MAVNDTYADALRGEQRVSSEIAPISTEQLQRLLQESGDVPPVFVGSGQRGGPTPEHVSPLIRLDQLSGPITVSTDSITIHVPASTTWKKAEDAAATHGLSLDHLVDTWPSSTVGGTLAATEILPPLWLSATARSVCLGLSALSMKGVAYDHIQAPRTASGPDLRALFFGCHGANGPIVSAVIEARRSGDHATLVGPLSQGLQRVINEYGSVLSFRGDTAGLAARVRLDSNLGRLAAERVRALGFQSAVATRPARPETVLTVPWAQADAAEAVCGASSVIAIGPTHVAFGASFEVRDAKGDSFGTDPLCRWIDYAPRGTS